MANRLATESSPYLRQHSENPVDWYPWGEEALRRAREEGRPILLSVGYSACHWCHVMAHESFENPEIAALMNELFVNVKVDREERPDVDAVYMQAIQAMTGRGGWPMTVFLTPEGAPYFGGTYFPPQERAGMAGFPTVLRAAHQAYHRRRDHVERAAAEIGRALVAPPLPPGEEPAPQTMFRASARLVEQSDPDDGGFGEAPKFPHPAALELLLRRGFLAADRAAADVVRTSLDRMLRGGIFDQLGGGFHRYSVDARWAVPHFEKMHFDNAQLATVYLHAFLLSRDPEHRRAVVATLDYLVREMRLPGGGFASSQDADSEGAEGRYFVWTPAQVAEVLERREDAEDACGIFGISEPGNFEAGESVLSLARPPAQLAAVRGITEEAAAGRIQDLRRRLLSARERRGRPARGDKGGTAWNGPALRAFAEAGTALDRPDYVAAARDCASFVLSELVVDGHLRRSWKERPSRIGGFLEDLACLGDGLIALYEATGDSAFFGRAAALAEEIVERFRDPAHGYFDTAADAEPLLVRPRGLEDNPLPAGQSMAAQLFLRLAALTGEGRWRDRCLEVVRPLVPAVARVPLAVSAIACVLDQAVSASREVAVAGPVEDPATRALLREVWRRYDPYRVLAWGKAGMVPLLTGRPTIAGLPTAYVCESFVCRSPTADPEELATQLEGSLRAAS